MSNPFRLMSSLLTFLQADSYSELRRILELHPDLLNPDIDVDSLGEAILKSQGMVAGEDETKKLEERLQFLRRCREVGSDRAFAEKNQPQTDEPFSLDRALQMLPPAQRFEVVDLIRKSGDWNGFLRALRQRPDLARVLSQAVGVDVLRQEAREDRSEAPPAGRFSPDFIQRALNLLSPSARRRVLELLSASRDGADFRDRLSKEPELSQALQAAVESLAGDQFSAIPSGLRELVMTAQRLADAASDANPDALKAAVSAWRKVLDHPDAASLPSTERMAILNDAGAAFFRRAAWLGELEDLNRALQLWEEALSLLPAHSPHRVELLANLAAGIRQRAQSSGNSEDLDQAIAYLEEALEIPAEESKPPGLYTNAANALLERFQIRGDPADLQESISMAEQALTLAGSDPLRNARYRTNLGAALGWRYGLTGDAADLERMIGLLSEAVDLAPPGTPIALMSRNNLATAIRRRYERQGDLQDLESAVSAYREVVDLAPVGSADRPMFLANLGNVLKERSRRSGDMADLNESIRSLREAVEGLAEESRLFAESADSLVAALLQRYNLEKRETDLSEALEVCRKALDATSDKSPYRPSLLRDFGRCCLFAHQATGEEAHLERAIDSLRDAAAGGEPARRPDYLSLLGSALASRYLHSGQPAVLDEAIHIQRQALSLASRESINRPVQLNDFGYSLMLRHRERSRPEDLEQAREAYDEAVSLLNKTLPAMPISFQLQQQADTASLYLGAVRSRALSGATEAAMSLAESSKSRLLSDRLARGALPLPPGIPASLSSRERELVNELAAVDGAALARQQRPSQEHDAVNRQMFEKRRDLWERLETVWREITACGPEAAAYAEARKGGGFSWNSLRSLAVALGPETTLLSLFIGSDATFLSAYSAGRERPQTVEVAIQHREWREAGKRFLEEVHHYEQSKSGVTWHEPLAALMRTAAAQTEAASHVVIAADGLAHLLPWSFLFRQAGVKAAVSTVPSLSLLPLLLGSAPAADGGALVVGNPTEDLDYAMQEAVQVARILGTDPILGKDATKEAVLSRFGEVNVAHFATHGFFSARSALDSGIHLANGTLTAREILESGLRAPPFLALSACQTGMIQPLAGEELAGLSQAFLYAGSRSLLVGLWEVDDLATARLLSGFYELWMKGGLGKAPALQRAADNTRAERPSWRHPYFSDSFALVGDHR